MSFVLKKQINIQEDLLIFDEIQACPTALISLKYFSEDLPELAVCSAGSLLGIYLGPLSFPVGKVDMLNLMPMNFEEFLQACNESSSLGFLKSNLDEKKIPEIVHDHLWTLFKYYLITGGLPEVVQTFCENKEQLFVAFEKVRQKQQELVIAYFADMAKHSGKVNAMHLDRVFKSVPQQLQESKDKSTQKYKFRGVLPGISHYHRFVNVIDWLKNAGLIHQIPIIGKPLLPLDAYGKENNFKLMLFDVGILGSMIDLPPKTILDYEYGSYKGFFAENFVAQELFASNIPKLHCWIEDRKEVEFLTQINGRIIPIEVKSASITKTKSLEFYAKKYKPELQIVFRGKLYRHLDKKNLYEMPLYLAGQFYKKARNLLES